MPISQKSGLTQFNSWHRLSTKDSDLRISGSAGHIIQACGASCPWCSQAAPLARDLGFKLEFQSEVRFQIYEARSERMAESFQSCCASSVVCTYDPTIYTSWGLQLTRWACVRACRICVAVEISRGIHNIQNAARSLWSPCPAAWRSCMSEQTIDECTQNWLPETEREREGERERGREGERERYMPLAI